MLVNPKSAHPRDGHFGVQLTYASTKPTLVQNEIYHIFNRGVEKRDVFLNDGDHKRFIETLKHYLVSGNKLSRKHKRGAKQQLEANLVEIFCYVLMPNHFHLLTRQKNEEGISIFMNRVQLSFTKYFNTKNDRVGPLFQGRFKSVRIENDEQLLHVSRYIHLNPLVSNLVNSLEEYQWSSYPAYTSEEQNDLVATKETLAHFPSKEGYRKFVLDQADYARTLEQIKHHALD